MSIGKKAPLIKELSAKLTEDFLHRFLIQGAVKESAVRSNPPSRRFAPRHLLYQRRLLVRDYCGGNKGIGDTIPQNSMHPPKAVVNIIAFHPESRGNSRRFF